MAKSRYKITSSRANGLSQYPKTIVEAIMWDKEKKSLEVVLKELEEEAKKGGGIEIIEVGGDPGNLTITEEKQSYILSKMANNTLIGTILHTTDYWCQIIGYEYSVDTAGFAYVHFSGGTANLSGHLFYD